MTVGAVWPCADFKLSGGVRALDFIDTVKREVRTISGGAFETRKSYIFLHANALEQMSKGRYPYVLDQVRTHLRVRQLSLAQTP